MTKAKLNVGLYLRYRTPEGKQSPPRPAAWDSKSRLRPGWCMVRGVAEHHPAASYHLRYTRDGKQAWEAVGTDPNTALSLRASRAIPMGEKPRIVVAKPLGKRIVLSTNVAKSEPDHMETARMLGSAINEYLTTGKAAEKDWRKHTLQCYTLGLKLFRESCKKTLLDEIDGDDLRQFKVYLRAQKTSVGKKIDPRTVYNHFLNVVSFLNTYGRKELIPQSEWPTFEKRKVVTYSGDVMARLLKFADVDEADVLEFFLGVGFRNGEGAHIEWHDIDQENKEVHVYSKRER